MLDRNTIVQQLIGNAALTIAFVLIAWALAREAAQWLIRSFVMFGVVVSVAILVGFLDNTAVSGLLYWVGSWITSGIAAVAGWLVETWGELAGAGDSAA
jgi:hypothetical protein